MQALAGRDLASATVMERLPQTLVNVEVADLEQVAGAAGVWEAAEVRPETWRGEGGCSSAPPGPSRWSG